MGPYNDNMNFQLKHLMREQLCVHNTTTWECVSERLKRGPWVQALRGFKVIPCLPNIHQAQRARARNPTKALWGFHLERGADAGKLRWPSYRVCPLQLQGEGGRVWKMPSFHSPPGRWHRLGMRGHGGTAASSINRKWVWLQNRHCTLLVVILSQQPGKKKKERERSLNHDRHSL